MLKSYYFKVCQSLLLWSTSINLFESGRAPSRHRWRACPPTALLLETLEPAVVMGRFALSALAVAAAGHLASSPAAAAGMNTHTMVGYRAAQHFGLLQVGAFGSPS